MYAYTDLYLAHPLDSRTHFDIVVNSAYALLTTTFNYNLTNTRKPSLLVYEALCYSLHYIQHTYCMYVRHLITYAPHNVHINSFCSLHCICLDHVAPHVMISADNVAYYALFYTFSNIKHKPKPFNR